MGSWKQSVFIVLLMLPVFFVHSMVAHGASSGTMGAGILAASGSIENWGSVTVYGNAWATPSSVDGTMQYHLKATMVGGVGPDQVQEGCQVTGRGMPGSFFNSSCFVFNHFTFVGGVWNQTPFPAGTYTVHLELIDDGSFMDSPRLHTSIASMNVDIYLDGSGGSSGYAPYPGVCSLTHYSCSAGATINQVDHGTYYTWTCQGSLNGGASSNCSETKVTNAFGVCSTSPNGCSTGTPFENVESPEFFSWRCRGTGTEATKPDNYQTPCIYFKLLDGVCATAASVPNGVDYLNTCMIGTATNIHQTADTSYWDCLGTGPPTHATRGSTAVNCSQSRVGTGTINVTSSHSSASWILYGYGVGYVNAGNPSIIRGSGPPKSYSDMPPGVYGIVWNSVPDESNGAWRAPSYSSLTLVPGGTISFNGVYTFTPFKVVVRDVTISSDFVRVDGTTPYIITVTGENFVGDGNNILYAGAYVNQLDWYRGHGPYPSSPVNYGMSPVRFNYRANGTGHFAGVYAPYEISCSGGGLAVDFGEWSRATASAFWLATFPRTHRLTSCSTSVSGNIRAVSFTALIYPPFMYAKRSGGNNGPYNPQMEKENLLSGSVTARGGTWANGGTVEVDSTADGPIENHYFDAGLVSPNYTLSVTKDGTGAGTFTMTDGATPPNIVPSTNINCVGMPCTGTELVPSGGTRIITAHSDFSSVAWTGCTSVIGNVCSVSNIIRNTSVTATFTLLPLPSIDIFFANPNQVLFNANPIPDTSSRLVWSATNATACYITGGIYTSPVPGEWYGTYVGGANGFVSTGNLTADTPYTVNCHNGVVWAANPKTVTVTVTNPATLKICPNPCTVSGTSFNGRTITGVPTTPLYACYGTGDCSAPDTNVSATWSAVNSPNNAIKFRGVVGTSTVSSSVNVDRDYLGSATVSEDIKLSYPSATDATTTISLSCNPLRCTDITAQTNAYCPNDPKQQFDDSCGGQTQPCAGTKSCNYDWTEGAP